MIKLGSCNHPEYLYSYSCIYIKEKQESYHNTKHHTADGKTKQYAIINQEVPLNSACFEGS